jgi:hypothetical protein
MNTGLHDASNLAWKLDFVLHGRGGEQLLDNSERVPVIKQVIERTDFLTKVMGTPNKLAQALRNTVIPVVSRLTRFQHAFVQRLSELAVAYPGSPIVEGAGKRYFDDSMRGGKGVNSRFMVMIDADRESPTMKIAKRLFESFRDIVELRSSQNAGVTLVRPDGYIAFSAQRGDLIPVLASVRSLLERHYATKSTNVEHCRERMTDRAPEDLSQTISAAVSTASPLRFEVPIDE